MLRRDLLSRVKLVALRDVINESYSLGEFIVGRSCYHCGSACVSYAMHQMAMIAIEKVFKRGIEPRIKALEQSVDALRGEKKRWVSDKS